MAEFLGVLLSRKADRAAQQRTEHSGVNHSFSRARQLLIIFTQPTPTTKPGKTPLHNPAMGQNGKGRHRWGLLITGTPHPTAWFLDNLLGDVVSGRALFEPFALVALIHPHQLQTRKVWETAGEYRFGSLAIREVRSMNYRIQHEALCVDQNVALAATDFLRRIIATFRPPFSVVFID